MTETNDPPVITGQSALSVQEDQSITLKLGDLTVTDSDDTYPEGFMLLVGTGTNYTVSGLTVTPAADFAGTLTVPVRVNDGVSNSALYNPQIQVTQINDAPGFAVIANQEVSRELRSAYHNHYGGNQRPQREYPAAYLGSLVEQHRYNFAAADADNLYADGHHGGSHV